MPESKVSDEVKWFMTLELILNQFFIVSIRYDFKKLFFCIIIVVKERIKNTFFKNKIKIGSQKMHKVYIIFQEL